jgi:hypothetical protein
MAERMNARRVLVVKPEENSPVGSPRLRWEDNIRVDLREIESGGMDWIHLAQDRGR